MNSTLEEHAALVAWLSESANYLRPPQQAVEQIETHISRVFLAGDDVYKLKKRVKFDFLDFTSLTAREIACREELRLNRRLAAGIYLAVLPILRTVEGFRWGASGAEDGAVDHGEIVDWLIHMRRMPTERSLDALLRRGELQLAHVAAVAELINRFYRSLPPLDLSPACYRERYAGHVQGNRQELLAVKHHLPMGVVERVHCFQLQLLHLQPQLFDARVLQGCVVDGHGDLRPEHIILSEPPVIFDCIEFNAEFRTIDKLDELAFLAAECDFLDANWVGPQLLDCYETATGDHYSRELLAFYKSYRACVRAKIAAIRAEQLTGNAQASAAAEAARHLALADEYASPFAQPLLLVVGGLSGSGKSTLAAAVAAELGAELLRTDVIRRDLFSETTASQPDGGVYAPAAREAVYREMFLRGAGYLSQKNTVIFDATFGTNAELETAAALAKSQHAQFLALECRCPAEVAKARILRRLEVANDPSDARPETYDLQAQRWETWDATIPQIAINTAQPIAEQLQTVLDRLQRVPNERLVHPNP